MEKIGFIGCGTMGKPMALNLIKAGYSLTVHDLNPEPIKELVAAGATAANSPREVAEKSDVVITMLPSSPHVEQVNLGPDGILEGLKAGSVIIDMSTIDPIVTRKVAAAANDKGIEMLDSPVGGSSPMAIAGTLPLFVGGKKETIERCRNILLAMGEKILHVGDVGMGEVVKLANNLMGAVCGLAMCEAFTFGIKLGADPKIIFEVLSSSGARILWTKVPYPNLIPNGPADQDFAPGFPTDLMIKDLGLALSAADTMKMPLLACNLTRELLKATSASGLGQKDWTILRKILERLAGDKD